MVRIIFLAGKIHDEMIGSSIFTEATTVRSTTTTSKPTKIKNENENEKVCKTKIRTKLVEHKKSNSTYKVWWCRKANKKMKIVKFSKVVKSSE